MTPRQAPPRCLDTKEKGKIEEVRNLISITLEINIKNYSYLLCLARNLDLYF